jgi:hypothetical protein
MGKHGAMKTFTTLASLSLVAVLSGCGGGGGDAADAASDATREDYCSAFASQFETLSTLAADDREAAVEASRDWAEELQRSGTPEDMPQEARRGYEAFVDELAALDADSSMEELENVGQDEEEAVGAFVDYSLRTCPEALSGMLGEMGDQMGEDLQGQLDELEGELGGELGNLDLGDLEGELEGELPGS